MALISMRQLLDHAAEHGYGIPAFNANHLEQAADFVQNRLQENGKKGLRRANQIRRNKLERH